MDDVEERETRETTESNDPENVADQNKTFLPADVTQAFTETLNIAKNWGAQFYQSVSAAAGEVTSSKFVSNFDVNELAKNMKETIEKVPIIRDFQHTQNEFIAEQSSKPAVTITETYDVQSKDHPAYFPWDPEVSGYSEPAQIEELRKRILSLSQQPNTFLLAPPVEAQIDQSVLWTPASIQLAEAMLDVDENLKEMRFKLVPSKINEDMFWRNYFYRLLAARESFQLSAMSGTQSTADGDNGNDFVCIGGGVGGLDSPPDRTSNEEKKKPRKTSKKSQQKKQSGDKSKSTLPTSLTEQSQPPSKPHSDLTPEELIEAELAREMDEMVVVSPTDADEIDRQLELELMAEMGEKSPTN